MARVGQGIDARELLLNRPRQGERIQAGALPPQGRGHNLGDLRARGDAVQRGLRGVIAAADAPTDPLLAEQLDGGQEEVLEQPEVAAVQRLDRGLRRRRAVVAQVPEQLADVRPVLLLGQAWRTPSSAVCTAPGPLPSTAAVSTQGVWMSVTLSECPNFPSP